MEPWKPDRRLRLVLLWTALTTLPFWLVTVRGALDGPTYEWGLIGLGGRGMSGDYWFPLLAAAGAALVRWLGWRRPGWALYILLAGWNALLAGGAVFAAMRYPEIFRFRGDTLGVDVSLAAVGPILTIGFLVLALWWIATDVRRSAERFIPTWSPANTRRLAGLVALVPIQFLLLRFGAPHGTTDAVGVILTIVQWFALDAVLRPREQPPPASSEPGYVSPIASGKASGSSP